MALTQRFSSGLTPTATRMNEASIPVVSSTSDISDPYVGQIVFSTSDTRLWRCTNTTPTWVVFSGGPTWAIYRATAQSITHNTWTFVNFDSEDTDTGNMHSTVTNTFAVTINQAGLYALSGKGGFVSNNTGVRAVRLTRNGNVINGSSVIVNATQGQVTSMATPTCYVQCANSDVLGVQVWQQSGGGALNTSSGTVGMDSAGDFPIFTGTWLRD